MSIQDNQWFADITDFFEEHGGSLSQDQRGELHELCTHVPRRSESGDLWYRRFGEEAVKNLKLTKERDALAERAIITIDGTVVCLYCGRGQRPTKGDTQ